MALVMVNNEDLYHFENVEDAFLWLELNPADNDEPRIILGSNTDNKIMESFIHEHYPIEIS